MSVAVATPTGLLVPVLRNCQNMKFHDIEYVLFCLYKGNCWIGQKGKIRENHSWRHARWNFHHLQWWYFWLIDGNSYSKPSSNCHPWNALYYQQASRKRNLNSCQAHDVFGLDLRSQAFGWKRCRPFPQENPNSYSRSQKNAFRNLMILNICIGFNI